MTKRQQMPTHYAMQAAKLFASGQYAAAEVAANSALGVKPSDAEAIGILGLIDAQAGRFDSALKHLIQSICL